MPLLAESVEHWVVTQHLIFLTYYYNAISMEEECSFIQKILNTFDDSSIHNLPFDQWMFKLIKSQYPQKQTNPQMITQNRGAFFRLHLFDALHIECDLIFSFIFQMTFLHNFFFHFVCINISILANHLLLVKFN